MMSYLFYLIFMIPLFKYNFWYLYQFLYMFFVFFFFFLEFNSYLGSISYLFGIDFFSYNLVILSFYIISLMNLSSCNLLKMNSNFFSFLNYLIGFLLILIFSSLNMMIMYISFELILIPLVILITGWGYQSERLSSGLYLFFYTLFGSLPLFLFILFFYNNFFTLSFIFSFHVNSGFIIHFIMIIPFLVKFPMFMFHFWLPKAHVQAPISGSMILAGLMLSIGGYGLIRFGSINDLLIMDYGYMWFSLGMVGSILVSMICFIQVDVSCLIAYSSVCHMGLCLMGLLTMTKLGVMGSLIMMVSHGLCSSALFCLANICYFRLNSRSLYLLKGMIYFMPMISLFWFMFSAFNMGCPPSINFMSEVLIFISSLYYFDLGWFFLVLSSFFSACFSFYIYSYSQHGCFMNFYSYCLIYVSEILLLVCHLFPLINLLFWFNMF
uniref:NADH-ubiquinone oxidoreductase chain 4 n=1 Tax=Hemicentrus obliquus TaxID=3065208 RepID=A0AA95NLI8_9HEMI|nr:NADH dehydrogenase subunit 4 [Hemicentrus obliquus]WKZ08040.1 NADH dehydrogenase subunit 4 [Hemicentrus obliquus]